MSTMATELENLLAEAKARIARCGTLADLDEARVHYLGKKGVLTLELQALGKLPAAERPAAGQRINQAKQALAEALDAHKDVLEQADLAAKLSQESVDVS